MQSIVCGRCGHAASRSTGYEWDGATVCETCGLAAWEALGPQAQAASPLINLVDPTVCTHCGHDNGTEHLPTLGGAPACLPCCERARRYPFPTWVRVSFVALLLLAVASFLVNLRFLHGYREVVRAGRLAAQGDFDGAAALASDAAMHVPESAQVRAVRALYRGIVAMRDDNYTEAVALLHIAHQGLADPSLDPLLVRAQAGAAFEAKSYDRFLEKTLEFQKLVPDAAIAEAGVASAFACKFAVTGEDAFAQQALAHLEAGRRLADGATPEFRETEERILHRLETREIISRAEWLKRTGR